MKKLILNVDTLQVQSFEAASSAPEARMLGTRVTRCYSECNACTYTDCNPEQRTEIDCIC